MGGAAATVALEQLADFDERERKDDAFRLGELERALQRGSDRARIAPLLVRQGIEALGHHVTLEPREVAA